MIVGDIMKKFNEKNEFLFCMILIVIYILVNSLCINLFGMTDYRTAIINIFLSIGISMFIIYNNLSNYFGLSSFPSPKKYLYFIPLIMITSVNLWGGIYIGNSTSEIIFYIISMIGVGFLEEIIFRGFLFRMMEKANVKSAIIVSAITFGVGHIINLLNGAELIPPLIQVCYATSIGFLFVIKFYKSKSLIPCIITHCIVNSLSIFNIESTISSYIAPIILTIIPIIYTIYINKTVKE